MTIAECQCLQCTLARARAQQVSEATPVLADGSHQGTERSPLARSEVLPPGLETCSVCGGRVSAQGSRVHHASVLEQRPCPGSWRKVSRSPE